MQIDIIFVWQRTGQKFMNFLKILFTPRNKGRLNFKMRFQHFQELLAANDEAHKYMSEMAELIASGKIFSKAYANKLYRGLNEKTFEITKHLVIMSNGKYRDLIDKAKEIEDKCSQLLSPRILCTLGWDCPDYNCPVCERVKRISDEIPYAYNLTDVDDSLSMEVGTKMSRLGEVKKKLSIPIPDGFCLTVKLFEDIMLDSDLRKRKDAIFFDIDFDDINQVQKACRDAQELFITTHVPDKVVNIIHETFDNNFGENSNIMVSVRSSAIGEDSADYSFAGLHYSALNVSRDNLVDAVYEVLISKYSPQSVVYRYFSGLRDEDMPMSVGCMKMVDAAIAGVMFTIDPVRDKDVLLINAVKGLGTIAVSGQITPQTFIVAKTEKAKVIEFKPGNQQYQEKTKETDGIEKKKISLTYNQIPLLTEKQIKELAGYALKIEEYYGSPQDIEWAIDQTGKIYILQVRPLQIRKKTEEIILPADFTKQLDDKYELIIKDGESASGGVAFGEVFVINNLKEINDFPKGSIIVTKKTQPELTSLIHKASGFITEIGSTTGHLSIIAREQNIPVLMNVENATSIFNNGMEITLFANEGRVYKGKVVDLINAYNRRKENENLFLKSPIHRLWHRVSNYMFKLNLTTPNSARFAPEYCETYHDVIRLAHELSMREMFSFYESARYDSGKTYRLKFEVPLDIYVINLGGGLKIKEWKNVITVNDIISKPFNALIAGMTSKGIEWGGPLAIDVKGFLNIMMTNISDPHKAERDIGSKSYALISDNYVNFFSRLGYHFSRLDALASGEVKNNYINFHFRGGAADAIRKARRAKAITKILESLNFTVINRGDTVISDIRKISDEEIYKLLKDIGRLMGAVRNTDVTMLTDKHIDVFVQGFLEGDPAPVKRFYKIENISESQDTQAK